MSNYRVGNIYAPLPSSSNYSRWATVSYSLDPADASGVVSTQGHLVKNTIRAYEAYTSYIEPNNLRSGWGGIYTWRSGEMNVNEGPTADNCAFYVKYKGQWINLRDNTAVEQAGLDDIFELQTVSTTGQRYYVLLRTWDDTDEDKYLFGYTVSIKQNSTLEDFKDSTDEAAIIQFLADINFEDTGEYVDTVAYTTLGGTSPSFEISDAVEEIWETGAVTTGELWTATRSIQQYYQGFPLLRTPLTNLPWLKDNTSNRLNSYYSCGSGDSDSLSYGYFLLKNGGLKFALFDNSPSRSYYVNTSLNNTQTVIFYLDENYNIRSVTAGTVGINGILNSLYNNEQTYFQYTSKSSSYVLIDVIGGGGGGGRGNGAQGTIDTAGGGGGGGGYCRCVVYLGTISMLIAEVGKRGKNGNIAIDGGASRICSVSAISLGSSPTVSVNFCIECDGGHAGFGLGNTNGGNGGAVYKRTYSRDEQTGTIHWTNTPITQENSDTNENINTFLPGGDVRPADEYNLGLNGYLIAAVTGGWGGLGYNSRNGTGAQYGFAPLQGGASSQPLSSYGMWTTRNGFINIPQKAELSENSSSTGGSPLSNSGKDRESGYGQGGGGGLCFNPNVHIPCYGGGSDSRTGYGGEGTCGCGGAGGCRDQSNRDGGYLGGNGGGGAIYVWR